MTDFPSIPGYRVERELGRGGMARVYLAVDEKLERHVALKVLLRSLTEEENITRRFLREAKTAANLRHSNIVPIFDVGRVGENFYFVMEYLDESLKERIRRGSLEEAETLQILRQVASALAFAHRAGLIHRDIKPDNILFRSDGTAVLTDFGIAKAVEGATSLTATGTSIGTPYYMSPEQGRGEKIDGRADIYSLGIVLYEMLTDRVPYEAENTVGIVIKHIQEPIPELPTHLARYQPLLDRMLAKDREERVGSGEELIRLIREFEDGARGFVGVERGAFGSDEAGDLAARGAGRQAPRPSATPPGGVRPGVAVEKEPKKTTGLGLGSYGGDENRPPRSRLIPVLVGALIVLSAALIYVLSGGGGRRAVDTAVRSDFTPPKAGDVWREPETGMEFMWIPPGEFMMGSNFGHDDEKPVQRVRITKGFWLGKYEVTQGQWRAVMGSISFHSRDSNPSHFKKGDNYPVESVSWKDAQALIQRLNSRTEKLFRLPTEAEWEYACRVGTTGDRYGNLNDIAWYDGNSNRSTQPVGGKQPNAFGLYDMLGNVWEWVQDWYGSDYYGRSPVDDPQGPPSGSFRVIRGGSWRNDAQYLGTAVRSNLTPSYSGRNVGFRLARTE